MLKDGIDPYESSTFHYPPILLYVFNFVISNAENLIIPFWILLDIATAWILAIACQKVTKNEELGYSFNPITIMSTGIFSISVLHNFLAALVFNTFVHGSSHICALLISFWTSLTLCPFVLFFSLIFQKNRTPNVLGTISIGLGTTVLLNYWLNDFKWNFVKETYLVMDDKNLHFTIMLIISSIFYPYPTLNHASVFFAIMPIHSEYKKYFRYNLIIGATIVSTIVLMPVMWHMWIVSSSGNANFFFAATLFYNMALIGFVTDLFFVYSRRQIDKEYGDSIKPQRKFTFGVF
ncbi:unnamed protein product [Caenorhabditis bovis]|uniref:Uncharacterized protein n=1 Tax=Caenorhabditis bovis TaxID=2654633 RepID=A0A8S1F6Y8_9PELO|nr:unnamed protein product [Caenorhabditis bovis]